MSSKTAAQIRAEKRRQRVLNGADSRIKQLTGEDRQAPSLEFSIRDPTEPQMDTQMADRISELYAQNQTNRLSEPRLKNPYQKAVPPPTATPGPASVATPPLSSTIQIAVIFLLSLICFLFRVNYSVAFTASIIGFISLQFFNVRTFIAPSPLLGMVPGVLGYLAKAAFYLYRNRFKVNTEKLQDWKIGQTSTDINFNPHRPI